MHAIPSMAQIRAVEGGHYGQDVTCISAPLARSRLVCESADLDQDLGVGGNAVS